MSKELNEIGKYVHAIFENLQFLPAPSSYIDHFSQGFRRTAFVLKFQTKKQMFYCFKPNTGKTPKQ